MNWLVPRWRGFASILLIGVTLMSCSNPEADRLREENAQLKSQLETISQERDAFKAQVESVRAALSQPSGSEGVSMTPTPGDSGSSLTPPSSPSPSDSASSDATGASSTGSNGTSTSNPQASPAVMAYAQEVLRVAAAYGAQVGTPPTDCANGYEAGADRLALGEGIALKACAVETVNEQLRVSLETSDGAKLTVPSNGP